jgi:hypothetical protein
MSGYKGEIMKNLSYIQSQLFKVSPFPIKENGLNGQYSIKITSDKGATNYIGISAQQMRDIEKILDEGDL